MRNIEIKNEIDEIKKWEKKVKREDLIEQTNINMIFNNMKR